MTANTPNTCTSRKAFSFLHKRRYQKKTDISFHFEEIHEGRMVSAVRFIITEKLKARDNTLYEDIIKLVPEGERHKNQIINLIIKYYNEHGKAYVISNIQYTNNKNTSDYGKYLSQALRHNWGHGLQQCDLQANTSILDENAKKRHAEQLERTIEEL